MGGQVSSCCGTTSSPSQGEELRPCAPHPSTHSGVGGRGVRDDSSQDELSGFKDALSRGIPVRVTLGDQSLRLLCDLHYCEDPPAPPSDGRGMGHKSGCSVKRTFFIICDINGERRVRELGLEGIYKCIWRDEDLAQLESAARIDPQNDHCVALSIKGGYLPLFFPNREDKANFVRFYESMQQQNSWSRSP